MQMELALIQGKAPEGDNENFTASTDIIRLNMYSFTQWTSVSLRSVDLRQEIANLILPERSLERIIVCQLVDVLQRISTNERRKERRYGQQTSREIMRGLTR